MASYNILLVVIACAFLFHCEADLISNVCAKSRNPSLCNNALRSDPRSRGADLKGLGQIIIDKSLAAVQVATNVAKAVETGKTRAIIETCIETQNDAKDNLNKSKRLVSPSSKEDLNQVASAAFTDVGTCDDEFGSREPARLQQASKTAQDLIQVLLIISNLL